MATKCRNCGCETVEEDPTHGHTVCTSCGVVLEDISIVSQIQFEENAQGGSSSIGQFVSSESRGGAIGFGGSLHAGILGRDSRELSIARAKKEMSRIAQLLRVGTNSVDAALNIYKIALQNNLTRGRKHSHVVAACLYINCRLEASAHLLIDFSEALQVCVFSLGRTYLRFCHGLCIALPFMDPCIYVLRYASKLDFGKQTHAVSMTALRLVSRMKKDNIHTGRRPSGLCGAALLIAARLHEFNRTVEDVIKIVKVHESTLRKRLLEFGSTPSSELSLNEFMTMDLEEEQDPPSFVAARMEDEERLQNYMKETEIDSFLRLRHEIEEHLVTNSKKIKRKKTVSVPGTDETQAVGDCIRESTLGAVSECLPTNEELKSDTNPTVIPNSSTLHPTLATMGLTNEESNNLESNSLEDQSETVELNDLDEDEIDSYIMTEKEVKYKDTLWMKLNATFLEEQKEKKERLAKEKEEEATKPKKRRKITKKPKGCKEASTPGEAIERMLVEKRISTKINYDVLKTLNFSNENTSFDGPSVPTPSLNPDKPKTDTLTKKQQASKTEVQPTETSNNHDTLDDFGDEEDEEQLDEEVNEFSLADMLNQHRDDDYYGGDDDY